MKTRKQTTVVHKNIYIMSSLTLLDIFESSGSFSEDISVFSDV